MWVGLTRFLSAIGLFVRIEEEITPDSKALEANCPYYVG